MITSYTDYVDKLADLLIVPTNDPNFQTILPAIIDYAEQRIYRELDLLSTVTPDSSLALTPSNRNFTLPAQILIVQDVNVITPAATTPDNGTRIALLPLAKEALNLFYPGGITGVPKYFAMISNTTIIVGPTPDQDYTMEVIGTIRPAPLSATNTTTYLTTYLPDLFMAASMIFASGYQKNFGSQADDPKMAMSWETMYSELRTSADSEEERKRFASTGWNSKAPTPLAAPARG